MALTPENNTFLANEIMAQPTTLRTYSLNFMDGKVGGFIDGKEALVQYVRKALLTYRDVYAIYSSDYGSELHTLIGDDITPSLLESEVRRMVKEAIEREGFVQLVTGVNVVRKRDKLYVTVTVEAEDGAKLRIEEVLNR